MKIGQMASYLDDGLPEPVQAALATLQQDAPPMAPELCAQVVRAELGDDPATRLRDRGIRHRSRRRRSARCTARAPTTASTSR